MRHHFIFYSAFSSVDAVKKCCKKNKWKYNIVYGNTGLCGGEAPDAHLYVFNELSLGETLDILRKKNGIINLCLYKYC